MRKRIAFRQLSRTSAHKWSMLRNQVSSLIEHERIVTTEAKAKELRHLADHVITLAKRGLYNNDNTSSSSSSSQAAAVTKSFNPTELHNRRRAAAVVRGDWNVSKLFDVLGPRYQFREGGYTRVMKLAKPRVGDNAPMAIIEYVDRPGEIRAARPPSIFQQQVNGESIPVSVLEGALRKMGIPAADDRLAKEKLGGHVKKNRAKNQK
jgi:large subunit ribosomal protein L17